MRKRTKAVGEFFDQLPTEMIELAAQAVEIKQKIPYARTLGERWALERGLENLDRRIILSAKSETDA